MADFEIYEGEDIALRYTIVDTNNDLGSSLNGVILSWIATNYVGGAPIIEYYSDDDETSIERYAGTLVCDVHIDGDDTRNKVGIMYYVMSASVGGKHRVIRPPAGFTGAFRIKQNDADQKVYVP